MKTSQVILTIVLLSCISLNAGLSYGQIFQRPALKLGDEEYVSGEIIVKFKPALSVEAMNAINSANGTSIIYSSALAGFKILSIPAGKTVVELVNIYGSNPNVEYAEANYRTYALMIPNDEKYALQWHLNQIRHGIVPMERAWNITSGLGTIVAILDTGIAYENYSEIIGGKMITYQVAPDLAGTCFTGGYDFVNEDSHPNDDSRLAHGTHIAGIIAQNTNNLIGTAGIAFSACLMPVKVLDKDGKGTYADLAEGIIWAADQGAHVINLGLGGSKPSTTLGNAIVYAYESGVTIVAAAGNEGKNEMCYPAAYNEYVISVGATRLDGNLASYSNYGADLNLVAPGGEIGLDQNGDGYGDGILQQAYQLDLSGQVSWWGYCFVEGTSVAAAQVSAVAALLIADSVVSTPSEVKQALQSTAEDKGTSGWDSIYGWGLVDPFAALGWVPSSQSSQLNAQFRASLTMGGRPFTVQFFDQSDGYVTGWLWDFGDGQTSTQQNPTHKYSAVSLYTVKLTVTGPSGSDSEEKNDYITVTEPHYLVPDFEAVPTQGDPPLTVQFTDKSQCYVFLFMRNGCTLMYTSTYVDALGYVDTWEWDFGDGQKSNTRNPLHIYKQSGSYTVSLKIKGSVGTEIETRVDYIKVNPIPLPVAKFAAEPIIGNVPLTVKFTDQSIGNITDWLWDFGDGQTSTAQNPSHTYQKPGVFTARLTVTGPGGSDTKSQIIQAEVPPPLAVLIDLKLSKHFSFWNRCMVVANVTVTHPDGTPLANATVQGHWSGAYNGSVSADTDQDGKVRFSQGWFSEPKTLTFTVDTIALGYQSCIFGSPVTGSVVTSR